MKCSLSCWDVTKKTGGKLVLVFNLMVPLMLNLSNEKCRNVNQIIKILNKSYQSHPEKCLPNVYDFLTGHSHKYICNLW